MSTYAEQDNLPAPENWNAWFKKYFFEGQTTSDTLEARGRVIHDLSGDSKEGSEAGDIEHSSIPPEPERVGFIDRHRKKIGIAVPIVIVHIFWWSYMISADRFGVFTDIAGSQGVPRWYMSITMVFGSMLAGATSEGGAAVAFPVMTLIFGVNPVVARDFSFMIQSCGMVAAAGTILWMKVLIEWKAVIYVTVGGIGGIIFGLEYCALPPPYAKMYFVVIWGAFAASLFWLNRIHGRKVYLVLNPPHLPVIWNDAILFQLSSTGWGSFVCFNWKAAVLVATGFLGGIFSSISGSGIDICSFACLTLLFRVTEKTATPTSIILMAINTVTGFLYRNYAMEGVSKDAWGFFLVCAPIVCFGAPFGSLIGSYVHRLVLAWAIYITDTVQLVAAIIIVKPWLSLPVPEGHDTPVHLTASSAAIFVAGVVFFYLLQKCGEKLMARNARLEEQTRKFTQAQLLSGPALGNSRALQIERKKRNADIS